MKHALAALLLTASAALGQPTLLNSDGTGMNNPTFRNAVLPEQAGATGKYLKTDGTSATWETVTAGKTDSMTTNRLLGRGTAGTGVIEEITLGTNLSLSGTTLNATGGNLTSGPVTSSGGVSAIADGSIGVAKITGLGTAAKIDAGMLAPRIASVLKAPIFTKDARHVTLLGLGDSLSHRTPNAMEQALADGVHVSGYALGNAEPIVVSGTVDVPGTAMNGSNGAWDPAVIDHGRVWVMASGSVVKIGRYYVGAALQTKSNVMNLWCSKQSGGGTLTVEHSEDNGSTWLAPGWTLATDGTDKTIAKQEFRIGAWATYQGTGTVYTIYSPSADTVTITGATGAYTGYNVTCARNGTLNGRPAYTVTGLIRVYFDLTRQEWFIGDPAATNPDFYINSFAEYPPTCATQRDTLGTKQRLWRLTASVGEVHLIGAKIWDFQTSGVIMAHAGNGGLALNHANQGAAAIRNGIGMDLGPTCTLATIVTNSADDAAIVNSTTIATFVDNWLTAIPVNDLVMFGNHAYTDGKEALNATIRSVLSTRPRAAFYDPIDAARNAGYIAAQDWGVPDATHYDDTFWSVVGMDVFRRTFAGTNSTVAANRIALDGSNVIRFGSHPVKTATTTRYEFPVPQDNRGKISMRSMASDGTENFVDTYWNPNVDSNTNLFGFTFSDNGYNGTPLQFDRNGAAAIGPVSTVSASSKSTQLWLKSRSSGFSGVRAETSGVGATELAQEWASSSAVTASMSGLGVLKFSATTAGISIKAQTNGRAGTGATLVAGVVTVANTSITANSQLIITKTAHGGTAGAATYVVTKIAATSFTITAINPTDGTTLTGDTSVFDWCVIERH